MQSQMFKDLKGENHDLVLAAAHIEDAKTGRSGDYLSNFMYIGCI